MAVALLRWVVENEETPAVSVTSLRHIVTASQRRWVLFKAYRRLGSPFNEHFSGTRDGHRFG